MRYLLGAIHPPTLHESTSERKATWMELFFDLAFVIAIASCAHSLSRSDSLRDYLEFAIQFVLLQWAWTGYTFYNDRFDSDDLLHRIAGLCQIFLVLVIATMHHWLADDFRAFVIAYVLLRLFTIGFNYYAGRQIPIARQTTRPLVVGYSIALIPLLVAFFVGDLTWRLSLVASTALLQLLPPLRLPARGESGLPLSVTHVPERLGLFVTLSLGECLAGLVRIGSADHRTLSFGLGCAFAISSVFCIWWVYFSGPRGGHLEDLAGRARVWVYGHIPLTMSIVAFAVGLEEQLEILLHPDDPDRGTLLFLSWGTALVCLAVIQAVSVSEGKNKLDYLMHATMLLFGVMSLAIAIEAWYSTPMLNLLAILVMGGLLVSISIGRDLQSGGTRQQSAAN